MKQTITLVIAILCLTGCQYSQQAKTRPSLPPTISAGTDDGTVKERLAVEQWSGGGVIHADESPLALLAAPVIGSAVKAGLKFLARKGGEMLEKYASQYGATYSATSSFGNFATTAGSQRYWFVFRRTLIFNSKNEAITKLKATPEETDGRSLADGRFEVDAMVVPFMLETTQFKKTSWRFVPVATLKDIPTGLTNMQAGGVSGRYPTLVEMRALKGRVLDKTGRLDNFKSTISITIRESGNFGGKADTRISDPAVLEITPKDLAGGKKGIVENVAVTSDWLPCPSGEAFSVKAQVIESSKTKEWIEQAAKKLVSAAEKSIDDLE